MLNKEALKGIGFEDKEITIYLALLELGECSVSELANWTGIKRPTAYVVLESLQKKEFVYKLVSNKKIHYIAQPPKRLESVAAVNFSRIKSLIPDLEILDAKQRDKKPKILIFEGKDKLDIAYEDFFSYTGEVLYIGNLTAAQDIFKESYNKLEKIEYTKEFRMRSIVDDSEFSRHYAEKNEGPFHRTRYIPKSMLPFDVDIGIYSDKIIITSVTDNYFSVRVQDKKIADSFKIIFEIMWLQLEPGRLPD